jgi:hypothetical protein
MESDSLASSPSKTMYLAGLIISGLASLFLVADGVMKLVKPDFVVEATTKLGYSEAVIPGLGVVVLVCVVLHLVPRTAILGAILLTGYLGGAVASHLRAGDGDFPVLFPAVFGAVIWVGLYLRDARLRAMIPIRR